ncbi:MAG: DUF370 domain-containing protein [Clostridia bacterium]|nr:DUF370 domain-containing protein [Clostridia bacterium]
MYLHIGNGKSLKKKDIIGIFDLDTATVSKESKKFINQKEKEGRLVYEDFDLPRSFLLCDGEDGHTVHLSRISSQGLKIRAEENKYE